MRITDMAPVAILIVLTAVVLSVGSILTADMGASTSANPTVTAITQTYTMSSTNGNLSIAANASFGQPSTCIDPNTAGTPAIPGTGMTKCNFTYGISKGWIVGDDKRMFPTYILSINNYTSNANVTLTYNKIISDQPYQAIMNSSLGQAMLSSWLPTISLVVAAAIIIGIVFGSFVLGRRE